MSNRRIDPTKINFDENTTVEVADLENEEYYVEGERLTEERAEQLAAEMLARVRAKNLRPGGKSLSGDQKHSPVVQVRVSEHTRDKLRANGEEPRHERLEVVSKGARRVCRTRDTWVIRLRCRCKAGQKHTTKPRRDSCGGRGNRVVG